MERMVRKQIYLKKQQNTAVKRLAKARGVSEAEFIRQAIENETSDARRISSTTHPDLAALDRVIALMQSHKAQEIDSKEPRGWKREDAYEERMKKYEHFIH